jgi:hypothetical protein
MTFIATHAAAVLAQCDLRDNGDFTPEQAERWVRQELDKHFDAVSVARRIETEISQMEDSLRWGFKDIHDEFPISNLAHRELLIRLSNRLFLLSPWRCEELAKLYAPRIAVLRFAGFWI